MKNFKKFINVKKIINMWSFIIKNNDKRDKNNFKCLKFIIFMKVD